MNEHQRVCRLPVSGARYRSTSNECKRCYHDVPPQAGEVEETRAASSSCKVGYGEPQVWYTEVGEKRDAHLHRMVVPGVARQGMRRNAVCRVPPPC